MVVIVQTCRCANRFAGKLVSLRATGCSIILAERLIAIREENVLRRVSDKAGATERIAVIVAYDGTRNIRNS